ncbi:MAG TPA: hypothetical protein VG713_03470 [Pirellulales bacterium]|nr:hypothetical protein [Pirellulales bacterium]
MRRKDSRMDGPISGEQLEFLAAISPEWREEKRRRERAGAEAAHQQEIDNFVRSITVPDWPHRGPSSTSGATQEFVEAITRPAWPNGERPMTSEEVQTFVDSITRHDGPAIYEAGWDPAKHPRVPAGQPGGGQWTSGGGTSSGSPSQRGDQNDGEIQAKTAEFSPSQGGVAHLTASSPGGHHWVPRLVIKNLSHRMTEGAKKIFSLGTEGIEHYFHGNDPWNGVKHNQYSTAVQELLDDWITQNGGPLDEKGARIFQSWLATGETKDRRLLGLLRKHKDAVATALKWRTGFKQSIVVAARAAELNENLTGPELKVIAKLVVNGEAQALSPQAHAVAQTIIKGGKKALMATAKRVLPTLMFLSAATAAKRGWAGQGHTGTGAWGAANEVARDAIAADVIEQMVFPAALGVVDGVTNIVAPGINDPTRYHRFKRNGVWIDAKTGLPSE